MTVIRTPLALLLESVGAGEWLLILTVILIVYGPARLPEMARRLGRWVARFQKSADTFRDHLAGLELDAKPRPEDPPPPIAPNAAPSGGDSTPGLPPP